MSEDILVPFFFFATISLIIYIVSIFNSKKRNTIHETIRHAIDSGQQVSPELIEKMSAVTDPVRADLRRGVLFIAFGVAFSILGIGIGLQHGEAIFPIFGVAGFPIIMGLAYLGLWAGAKKNAAAT